MKNNILITINDTKEINELKKLGITKFVYPLKEFCVGIPNTFLLSDILEEGYIYINRILDNDGIDKLRKVLNNLTNKIKGIIFDDLGIIELIKDLDIEKILYLSHFNTNSESVNIYLEFVDTVILPTDITRKEIEFIIKKAKKKVSLYTFGYVPVMYSRRLLIDNYSKFHNIKKEELLHITNDDKGFLVYENDYGTMLYYDKVFNGLELLDLDAKYYFYNTVFLSNKDIKNVLNNDIKDLDTDSGFLYKETIYKLKGE